MPTLKESVSSCSFRQEGDESAHLLAALDPGRLVVVVVPGSLRARARARVREVDVVLDLLRLEVGEGRDGRVGGWARKLDHDAVEVLRLDLASGWESGMDASQAKQ